jgi:hypothetical protein
MKLINEIITEALDNEKPIASVLRKCLVLSFDLKNEKLRQWVEKDSTGTKRLTTSRRIDWRTDLIAYYQSKFIQGYALTQAWQEVSEGLFKSMTDTVRTRVLRFPLEIREELGAVDDEPASLIDEIIIGRRVDTD